MTLTTTKGIGAGQNQRGDLYDLQRLQHLSSQNRLQQIQQALRKAGSNPSLRQLAQANAFNRQMNSGLGGQSEFLVLSTSVVNCCFSIGLP